MSTKGTTRITWNAENDRKLLLFLINPSPKDIDYEYLASVFPGATPKAIEERTAKLRRERKTWEASGVYTPSIRGSSKAANGNAVATKSKAGRKRKRVEEDSGDEDGIGVKVEHEGTDEEVDKEEPNDAKKGRKAPMKKGARGAKKAKVQEKPTKTVVESEQEDEGGEDGVVAALAVVAEEDGNGEEK